jgi:hypothetical protein
MTIQLKLLRHGTIMRLAYLVIMLFFVISCSNEHKLEQPVSEIVTAKPLPTPLPVLSALPADTGEPAMHAVRNSHLHEIMLQINALVYEQLQNEVGVNWEKHPRTQEIAKIAHELANDEKSIIASLPLLNLDSNEKSSFTALAVKLRVNAQLMEAQANQSQLKAIHGSLEQITSTCTACHALFRKTRSILDNCKDSNSTC